MQWTLKKKELILKTIPFDVEKLTLQDSRSLKSSEYFRLLTPNWVNIVPMTTDGNVVLVRQSRAGILEDTWEIPGGVIDPTDNSPKAAAERELEEETGYRVKEVTYLGKINPNPAIMANELYMYLGESAYLSKNRHLFPDSNESIHVELVPLSNVFQLAKKGELNSALTALAVMLAESKINE